MIKDLELNANQLRSLEEAISDRFELFVEVTFVQDEGDCFKAFYTYEDQHSNERRGSIYFIARILDSKVEDFEEITWSQR